MTWYTRDAQGNILSVYTSGDAAVNGGLLAQTELDVYGFSRLGTWRRSVNAVPLDSLAPNLNPNSGDSLTFTRGYKLFELTNHLGNVLATVSDKRYGVVAGGSVAYYNPEVVAANDYYPFGMLQSSRSYNEANSGNYRYGFNGKENDNEVKGVGDQQDYGMRVYDPRMARFLSVDPIAKKYPQLTPFQFPSDRPIDGIDLDGAEYSTSGKYFSSIDGVWRVNTTIKLSIINQSKIINTAQTIENIRTTIKYTIAKDQSGGIGTEDNPIVTTKIEETNDAKIRLVLVDVRTGINGLVTTGYTHNGIGQTQDNTTDVSVTIDGTLRDLAGIARTASHEQGHVAGLKHPFHGAEQTNIGASEPPLPTWKNNLMNSFGGSDVPGQADYNGVKSVLGHVVTTQQRATITKTVQSQQPNGKAIQVQGFYVPQWAPQIK